MLTIWILAIGHMEFLVDTRKPMDISICSLTPLHVSAIFATYYSVSYKTRDYFILNRYIYEYSDLSLEII